MCLKANKYKIAILSIGLLVFGANNRLWAQVAIERPYVINSAGGYGLINGQMFDFNFGELVLVQTFDVSSYLLTQGFLQPYFLSVPTPIDVKVVNNVITPNGDGKNDLLVVEGLANYPGSVVRILDRAGRLIYTAVDYKNDWNGYYNGKPLYEDTYYYVIDLGKGFGLIRGFISIIKDER